MIACAGGGEAGGGGRVSDVCRVEADIACRSEERRRKEESREYGRERGERSAAGGGRGPRAMVAMDARGPKMEPPPRPPRMGDFLCVQFDGTTIIAEATEALIPAQGLN